MKYLSEVYGKGGVYAKCVAASVANGIPIYTLETKAPKFIDAEFEKHRMLSSNSSSSRAIPFKKLDEIYLPFDLRKNQKGMQGYESLNITELSEFHNWAINAEYYIHENLEKFFKDKIHKQHLNRYLEPWMFQKKVVTATQWDNFFKLRLAPDAQPEIQELARCMKETIDKIELTELSPGEWHLPYINDWDTSTPKRKNIAIKCSVARCARVSYFNMDNSNPSVEKDLELYDRLLSSKHLSCFEHQATPMRSNRISLFNPLTKLENGITHFDTEGRCWSGNFKYWIQYRQLVSNWNE